MMTSPPFRRWFQAGKKALFCLIRSPTTYRSCLLKANSVARTLAKTVNMNSSANSGDDETFSGIHGICMYLPRNIRARPVSFPTIAALTLIPSPALPWHRGLDFLPPPATMPYIHLLLPWRSALDSLKWWLKFCAFCWSKFAGSGGD